MLNDLKTSYPDIATTDYVLCLTGMRAVNKRMTLFIEGVLSMGVGVRVSSLPRGEWKFDKSEQALVIEEKRRFSVDLRSLNGAKLRAVMCFHWAVLPLAVLLAAVMRVPVLYDEHDHYELNTMESSGSSLRRRFNGFLVRAIHRLCLPFVTVVTCIHMAQSTLKHHLQRWQPSVVELHNFPTKDWQISSEPSTNDGPLCFVYIGGVFEEKGPGVAARALQLLNPIQRQRAEVHIFGDGDPQLLKTLRKMDGVVVHNSVTPAEFRAFAATHRCCGLSLLADTPRYRLVGTNCTKLYEYLALQMPVIATRLGEFESFVNEHEVGLIVDGVFSAKQLAQAMARLLDESELYERMSRNAGILMRRDEMTWEHEWQKVESSILLYSLRRAA